MPRSARELAGDPRRFLPTAQIGITLVSMLTGVFGGARIAGDLTAWLATVPALASVAETLSLALVVVVTTYLTLVLGELVPKHLALRRPEQIGGPRGARDRLDGARHQPCRLAARQVVGRGAAPVRPASCARGRR